MKKVSHKNQIIITTLALLLAVVGYISYDNRDTFMNAKDVDVYKRQHLERLWYNECK